MSDIDPALLAALAGLLDGSATVEPDDDDEPEEEKGFELDESLHARLVELEALVN